ncbi:MULTISPECIES: hypothetical protein [Nocardiopsis]|uniref:Uncharacterized protein n=1 Tax=Nocardiopsis sinuspersici TaxID=501010 RepID=A0A1V3C1Y5_9ACTN|nr:MULTISPECIES: hypothetical protein [Nocardiopsis]OOC54526.1 hypothetical protein NOSIN_12495 [Nocardiopsis sinuspersici]
MTVAFDDHEPEPEDLRLWTARGFTVADARRWIDAGFALGDAERWRGSGVYRPGPAMEWRAAGTTPYTVRPMLRAGMTPRDAVRWHELGYSPAEAAERHLAGERPRPRRRLRALLPVRRVPGLDLSEEQAETMTALLSAGVTAATARAYLDTGWHGADAVPWARAGVDPAQARVYRAVGFSPGEGASLAGEGRDALSLMCEWWDAGVPRGEVAAWALAGFGSAEAARARVSGTGPRGTRSPRAPGGRPPEGGSSR